MSKIITCEQVSNGHPDKICDQIADAIVTDILQHDRNARVAIECLLKKSQLFIAGEVTTNYRPNSTRSSPMCSTASVPKSWAGT